MVWARHTLLVHQDLQQHLSTDTKGVEAEDRVTANFDQDEAEIKREATKGVSEHFQELSSEAVLDMSSLGEGESGVKEVNYL